MWSTEETHPPLVDVEDFTTAQALLGAAKSQPGSRVRSAKPGRTYALRGLVRCDACGRLLEGCWVNGIPRYRCRLTGSDYALNTALAARHGKCPSVREDRLTRALDALLVRLLDPANAQQVADAIAAAAPGDDAADAQTEAASRTLADADARLTRYRAALDSGGDPAIVGGWIAEAGADKARAEQDLRRLSPRKPVTAGDVLELLNRLGPIGERLASADSVLKARVYADLGLKIAWCPGELRAHVSVAPALPGGVYVRRVGGGVMVQDMCKG